MPAVCIRSLIDDSTDITAKFKYINFSELATTAGFQQPRPLKAENSRGRTKKGDRVPVVFEAESIHNTCTSKRRANGEKL